MQLLELARSRIAKYLQKKMFPFCFDVTKKSCTSPTNLQGVFLMNDFQKGVKSWTPSFKEEGEHPLGRDITHPLRLPDLTTTCTVYSGIAQSLYDNLLSEIARSSANRYLVCTSLGQNGFLTVACLHSKEVHTSPFNGAKLTPGLAQTLVTDWMSGHQATVLKTSSIPEAWITDPAN